MFLLSLCLFHSSPELESEPSHFAAQVFRPLLCPVGREEHPRGGDEQRPSPCGSHAPQIRPEGLHLQEASVQEGEREGQAHFQRPGLHARPAGRTDAGPGHLQRAGQDLTERLPGELDGGRGQRGSSLIPLLFYVERGEKWQERGRTSLGGKLVWSTGGGLLILSVDPHNTLIKSLQRDPSEREREAVMVRGKD